MQVRRPVLHQPAKVKQPLPAKSTGNTQKSDVSTHRFIVALRVLLLAAEATENNPPSGSHQ